VPPRGTAGGYPGAAGRWTLLRESNILQLIEDGVYPAEDALKGTPADLPSKTGELVLHLGDVFTVVNGGGGGVGDPLLRVPALVAKDVVDGYVSDAAARDVYGVVVAGSGAVDETATREQRLAIRRSRIGHNPEREVTDAAAIAPLRAAGGRWQCTHCGFDLGDEDGNWRERAVVAECEISERFEQLRSQVRRRTDGEPVVLRENFCPGCATALAVDVTLQGRAPVQASRLGVKEPFEDGVPA
jgi:N-methylhydantoinase B